MPRGGFVRIPVEHETVDHRWMVSTSKTSSTSSWSATTSCWSPTWTRSWCRIRTFGTLGDYIDRFDEEWVNCLGYETPAHADSEPPLRLDRPILEQRGHWFFNDGYDKAALATVPLRWNPGFHGRSDYQFNLDPDLRMIHLHRMDFDICLERHRVRSRRAWAEQDAKRAGPSTTRSSTTSTFRHWFYEDSCVEHLEIQLEPIPEPGEGLF